MVGKSLTRKSRYFRILLRENRLLASALGLFSVLPILFSSLVSAWLLSHYEQLTLWLADQGSWPVLALSLTMAFGLTPTTFVALLCGFFLGFASAGYLIVAYVLASAVGYGIGRFLDGGRLSQSLKHFPVAEKVAAELVDRPVLIVILMRLSPALPFCLMNLLLAALNVRVSLYLLAGSVGMLPRTLLSLWVGSQSRTIVALLEGGASSTELFWAIGGTVFTVVSLVWIIDRRMKRVLDQVIF